jgi:hypothetical protein
LLGLLTPPWSWRRLKRLGSNKRKQADQGDARGETMQPGAAAAIMHDSVHLVFNPARE